MSPAGACRLLWWFTKSIFTLFLLLLVAEALASQSAQKSNTKTETCLLFENKPALRDRSRQLDFSLSFDFIVYNRSFSSLILESISELKRLLVSVIENKPTGNLFSNLFSLFSILPCPVTDRNNCPYRVKGSFGSFFEDERFHIFSNVSIRDSERTDQRVKSELREEILSNMTASTRGLIKFFTFLFLSDFHVTRVTSRAVSGKITNSSTYHLNTNANLLAKFGFYKREKLSFNKGSVYPAGVQCKDPKGGHGSLLGPMLTIPAGNKLNKEEISNLRASSKVHDGSWRQRDARASKILNGGQGSPLDSLQSLAYGQTSDICLKDLLGGHGNPLGSMRTSQHKGAKQNPQLRSQEAMVLVLDSFQMVNLLERKIPPGVRVTHRRPLPTTQTHPIKASPEVLSPTQGGEQPSCSSGRLAAPTNNNQTSNKLFKIFLLFLSFLFWLRVCGEILILTHTILCFKYNFVFWKYFWFERRKRSFLRTFFLMNNFLMILLFLNLFIFAKNNSPGMSAPTPVPTVYVIGRRREGVSLARVVKSVSLSLIRSCLMKVLRATVLVICLGLEKINKIKTIIKLKILKGKLITKLGIILIKEKLNSLISKLNKLVKLINYKIVMKVLTIVIVHTLSKNTTIIVAVLIVDNFEQLLAMTDSMLKLIQRGFVSLHTKINDIIQLLNQRGISTLGQQENQGFSVDFTEGESARQVEEAWAFPTKGDKKKSTNYLLSETNWYQWSFEMKQILMAKDLWKNVKFSNVHEYYRDITSTAHKSLMKSYKPPIKTSTTTTPL